MKKSGLLVGVMVACLVTVSIASYSSTSATVPKINELISVDSAEVKGNAASTMNATNADGRYTVFKSAATNLISGDTNGYADIFMRDSTNGTTNVISVSTTGAQANSGSENPHVSHGGRYVVFNTAATNLVTADSYPGQDVYLRDTVAGTTELISYISGSPSGNARNGQVSADGRFVVYVEAGNNIYVRDRVLATTQLISKDSSGNAANGSSFSPSISCDGGVIGFISGATNLASISGDTNGKNDVIIANRVNGDALSNITLAGNDHSSFVESAGIASSVSCDGNYIAFSSDATNIVSGDTNGYADIFRYSRVNGLIELASKSSTGSQTNSHSRTASISGDGRYIAFSTDSTNLVTGDTNASRDIFIRDMKTGVTDLLSLNATGTIGNRGGFAPFISADGKYVSFWSDSSNLVSGDTDTDNDIVLSQTGY